MHAPHTHIHAHSFGQVKMIFVFGVTSCVCVFWQCRFHLMCCILYRYTFTNCWIQMFIVSVLFVVNNLAWQLVLIIVFPFSFFFSFFLCFLFVCFPLLFLLRFIAFNFLFLLCFNCIYTRVQIVRFVVSRILFCLKGCVWSMCLEVLKIWMVLSFFASVLMKA